MRSRSSSSRLFAAPSRGVAFAVSAALVVGVLSGIQGLAPAPALAEEDPAVATAPVELIDERTETSTTFENPDGTRTVEMSGSPIRVVDEDAADGWSDVDYNLEVKTDGTIAPIVSPVDLWISGGGTKEAARLTNDDGTFVAVTWPETLPEPSIDGGTATFAVSDSSSLVIIVTGAGFNAHIVLDEEPAAGDETFTLGLKTKDIDVSESNNHLAITDEDGDKVAESQSLIAWDSQVDDAGDPLLPVTLTADLDEGTQVGGTIRQDLELTTPAGYLSDPDTEYPVVIDPSLTQLTQTRDTYVVSGSSTSNGTSGVLRVGSNDGVSAAESYLQFNLAPITSAMTVLDVDMQLWQYYAPSCGTYPVAVAALTGEWDSNQTWATRPNASGTGAFTTSFANKGPSACANGWQSIDLTTMTNSWLDGTRVNRGIRISIPSAQSLNTAYDKRFCSLNPDSSHSICNMNYRQPKLVVTYASAPVATGPAASAPQTNTTVTSLPALSVVLANPSATGTEIQYVVGLNSEPSSEPVVQTAWAPFSAFQIPAGVFQSGAKYYWKVRLRDGNSGRSSISQIWNFHFIPNVPNHIPSVPVLDGSVPSEDTANGLVVGLNPIFVSVALDADAEDTVTTFFDVYNASSSGQPTTFLDRCENSGPIDEAIQCSPATDLVAGASYALRLRSRDDNPGAQGWSAWSGWTPFTASAALIYEPVSSEVQLPFDHAVSLDDAVSVSALLGEEILGYRFESNDLVGEWYPEEGESAADFLATFDADYATEPEVVAVIVAPQPTTVSRSSTDAPEPVPPIITGVSTIDAPNAAGAEIVEFNETIADVIEANVAAPEELPEGTLGAAPNYSTNGQWRPSSVQSQIYKAKVGSKKKVVFKSYSYWDGNKESAGRVDDEFGLEFEYDSITSSTTYQRAAVRCDGTALSYGHINCHTRNGKCDSSDARKQPFAKNRGWSWTVYAKYEGNTSKNWTKTLRAYKDYNDLWDNCRRNSIGVGLASPQALVGSSGSGHAEQKLFIKITAPKGADDHGKTGGRIQPVERATCGADQTNDLTDCMGTIPHYYWSQYGNGEAMQILNQSRSWQAPTKCWFTTGYGEDNPSSYTHKCGPSVQPW